MSESAFSVITDSTADIQADLAASKSVTVVPLSVTFGEETLPDGTLDQASFFERMATELKLPTTSQPSPGAFVEAYQRALETAPAVISIHISDKLSGTIESARQAAKEFSGRVHVFDSLNLSWGLGLQVMEAARMCAEGAQVEETLEALKRARERVRLIVGLDSLDNLAKGGRIGKVSAFMGAMLNLKVTLTVDAEGSFQPVARTRGERAALDHTLAWVAEKMGDATNGSFAVGYAMHQDRAEKLATAIRERYDVRDMVVYPAGSVICAHTGTGWGVAVLPIG
jgi:DegV family protein with EDD domain